MYLLWNLTRCQSFRPFQRSKRTLWDDHRLLGIPNSLKWNKGIRTSLVAPSASKSFLSVERLFPTLNQWWIHKERVPIHCLILFRRFSFSHGSSKIASTFLPSENSSTPLVAEKVEVYLKQRIKRVHKQLCCKPLRKTLLQHTRGKHRHPIYSTLNERIVPLNMATAAATTIPNPPLLRRTTISLDPSV